jgi:hypothetical protein
MLKTTFTCLILSAGVAQADLAVRFDEGAPKDRFTLTNTGTCALPAFDVTLDLGSAPSGLIFDVTGNGAGVQVFQPLALVTGQDTLRSTPKVRDGDNAITFNFKGLNAEQMLAFTIDVDDTSGGREITVDGSEIAGARVVATIDGQTLVGTFDDTARAIVKIDGCAF